MPMNSPRVGGSRGAGRPGRATAAFIEFPEGISYAAAKATIAPLLKSKDSVAIARLARELSGKFRDNYIRVSGMARPRK